LLSSLLLSSPLSAAPGGGLIADGTAGTNITLQDQTLSITGGTVQGGNLLHSFREFNVETGQTADFQAASDTNNIISRVTGTNDSWIDGKIQSTTSEANLYLVNPNGIVMGANASLDVNGAFHATTADYVTLADGQRVYADANQGVTLTVAAPESFGFLDADVGKIEIAGSQLHVADNQAMSLVGGEITLEADAQLQAPGGQINLVGIASAGDVQLTPDVIRNTTERANISFAASRIEVNNQADSTTTGRIRVQAHQLTARNSFLRADNNSAIDAVGNSIELQAREIDFTDSQISTIVNNSGQGGSIQLVAADQIRMAGYNSYIDLHTNSEVENAGQSGDLMIQATDITLADRARIYALTTSTGLGHSGLVRLVAEGGKVGISNSRIHLETLSDAANASKSRSLVIQAADITLTDRAEISAATLGTGDSGSVKLVAVGGKVEIHDSLITMETAGAGDNNGDGGDLVIQAADITLADRAEIAVATHGSGNGGSARLVADDGVVEISSNSLIKLGTTSTAANAGKGGDLMIEASRITLADGAQISAATVGAGDSGSVKLVADNGIVGISGGGINMETTSEAANAGKGGDLMIEASSITLADRAQISAVTNGSGDGGSVRLVADGGAVGISSKGFITLAGDAWIGAATFGTGDGGSVTLVADNGTVGISDGGISMETASEAANAGKGGDLVIQATDIVLQNHAGIIAETWSTGQGGLVQLTANQIQLSGRNTRISSSSYAPGAAGSVQIQSHNMTLVDHARIESTSGFVPTWALDLPPEDLPPEDLLLGLPKTGVAGQISIDLTGSLHMRDNSQITTTTAGTGAAGNILIGERNRPAELWMTEGARITSGSESDAGDAGDAGRLVILTGEQIQMHSESVLATESANAGGGGIRVETRDLLHLQNSRITTSVAGGDGRGGDIDIDPVFVILENSKIQANAHGGAGGNINLVANYLLRSGSSAIEASSALSTSGEIQVQAVDVDAGSLQVTTQIDPLDVAQWAQVPCHLRRGKISRLVMAGYDAHPTPVDDVLSSLSLYTTLRQPYSPPHATTEPIVPQARLIPPMAPLTVQHSYLLAAAGATVGCTI
jgi:filamentous hemagglutinin family protein